MMEEKKKKIKMKALKNEKLQTTTPTVWNPFEIMESMDRFFLDDPWRPMWRRHRGSMIPRDFLYERYLEPNLKQTSIDMIDNGKEFKIIAEMPGIDKKDVEISLTDNKINICGNVKIETKEENKNYLRRERSYSTLCRNMSFPEPIDSDKAEAILKDGILEISLPKKTPTKGRNLTVK